MSEQKFRTVQDDLHHLRQALQAGKIYETLGARVGEVLDRMPPLQPVTPVEQLTTLEIDEVQETSERLQQQLLSGDLVTVDNEALAVLVNALGQTSPAIREESAFKVLVQLIQEQMLTTHQLIVLRQHTLRPSVLFYHILEQPNDGAFLRSYNVCLLSVIKLWEQPLPMVLSDYEQMVDLLAAYLAQEQDTRGFVDGKGWVNSYLHIGHLLDAFNFDTEMRRLDKVFLLTVFFERYQRLETPLMMGEEKRLALYMVNLLNLNSLYVDYFVMQLKQMRKRMVRQPEPTDLAGWHCFHNQRRLLEALQNQSQLPRKVSEYLKNMNFF